MKTSNHSTSCAAPLARSAIAALSLLVLAGCANLQAARQQRQLDTAHAICQSAGFVPGQEGYGQCVVALFQQADANEAQRKAMAMQLGTQMLTTPAPAPRQPVVCRQMAVGMVCS